MRQIVLDTETTGLDWQYGHRVIEIGCVEIVNRRRTNNNFHVYINPERAIDAAAEEVHGLSLADLQDKPLFADVAADFLNYVGDSELIIHNASFDVGFLDNELRMSGHEELCLSKANPVLDTLALARRMHPGQRNTLDALCKRYSIDNSRRDLHGALLDSQLLADVYLAMTGGQTALSLGEIISDANDSSAVAHRVIDRAGHNLARIKIAKDELAAHEKLLDGIDKSSDEGSVWRR